MPPVATNREICSEFRPTEKPTLLIFAAAAVLYRFADASMLPLVSEKLGSGREGHAALIVAAIIAVPQIIVAVAAPWVAHYAEEWAASRFC